MKGAGMRIFICIAIMLAPIFCSADMAVRAEETGAAAAPADTASGGWKGEFDDTCGRTQDAMALSAEELKAQIDRCDKLKSEIDKLDGAQKKVYTRRLQMCRDLFQYSLDSKEGHIP